MNYFKRNLSQLVLAVVVLAASILIDPTASIGGALLATRRSGGKKKGISVDFTDVESSGGHVPEGDYLLEVAEVEEKEGASSKEPYLAFIFEISEGEFKGRKIYHNCSLQPQALFNLRNVLEALGNEVPKGVMDLDPEELVGQTCGASLITETYEGKKKSRVAEFFSADELESDAPATKKGASKKEEEEAPSSSKKKVAKKKPTFSEGDKVKFTDDDGEEQVGKITAIDDDKATVKVGRDEWEIDLDELEAA